MLKIVRHEDYDAHTVGNDHRFPMRKYTALADYVQAVGLVSAVNPFVEPDTAGFDMLSLAHDADYVRGCLNLTLDRKTQRQIGFEVTEAVVRRSQLSCGGSYLAGLIALDEGIACSAAGGSHHARRGIGAGFCVFNDVGVALSALKAEGHIRRALVIDCDVHQGDGTADIFRDDPDVFTLSVHCEKNWPVRKIPSDMDVGLDEGLEDAAYLARLDAVLADVMGQVSPDIVYYNAGVDPHRDDRLGKLCLSDQGIFARDEMVLSRVHEHGWPVVGVLGGGYSRDIDHLARLHGHMFSVASSLA